MRSDMFTDVKRERFINQAIEQEAPVSLEMLFAKLAGRPVEQRKLREAFKTPTFDECVTNLLMNSSIDPFTVSEAHALFALNVVHAQMALQRSTEDADRAEWLK